MSGWLRGILKRQKCYGSDDPLSQARGCILCPRGRPHDSDCHFRGKEKVWYVDFKDTYQTMKTFENAVYYIAMWMDVLPPDQYDIYLEIDNDLQNTGEKIVKQK